MTIAEAKKDDNVTTPAVEEVPEGWEIVRLPDVCEINPAKPPRDAIGSDVPVTFVPMPAVDADLGEITKPEVRTFAEVRKGYTSFREGDVIMAKITPCMENGKAAIAHELDNGLGFGSTEFHVLRPTEAVLADLVYHFIRQESFRREAEAEMTGSVGQKRVPARFLEAVDFPLPPLAEQRRIVAKVEELLARVNAARERLRRAPATLKRFRHAVLAAACSGRLTEDWRAEHPDIEPADVMLRRILGRDPEPLTTDETSLTNGLPEPWSWASCADLCDRDRALTYGVIKLGSTVPNGISTLRSSDVRWLRIDDGDVKTISPTIAASYARTFLRGGEVVVTVRGTLGGVAVVPSEMAGWNVSREVAVVPVLAPIDPGYVARVIASGPSQNWLMDKTLGVAYTGINIRDLKELPIPVPPIDEQREISRRVEVLFGLANAIERRVAAGTARADRLMQAILAKAFRGELVPTEAELARAEGREYEPASVTLERMSRGHDSTGVPPNHRSVRPKRAAQAVTEDRRRRR